LAFVECHGDLKTKLSQMHARCEAHLQESALDLAKDKVLSSLHNHWDGLTVFVGRPEVAMDNNTAERSLRNPVVGRKNSYGSGSVWSAHLAAMMFSVLQTALLWGLNPHHWLSAFLQACAESGSQSPTDLSAFLPWQMTPERREELARPMPVTLPPFRRAHQRGEPAAVDTSSCLIRLVTFPKLRQIALWLYPDTAKRVRAAFACPTGSEPASSVAGLSCPLNPGAMMMRCFAADFLAWVRRIFTYQSI
jgi:Transposase IS66 family